MSDHVFALRSRFRDWGYESQAFAVEAKTGVEHEARSYRELFRLLRPDDTLVLHFSTGNEVFDELPGEDVLGEVPGVQAIHASGLDLPQMR